MESEKFAPRLELAQSELKGFVDTIGALVGKKHRKKAYPVTVEGEPKIVTLIKSDSEEPDDLYVSAQVRDTVGINGSFPYKTLSCESLDGKLQIAYREGSLTQDNDGKYFDTALFLPRTFNNSQQQGENLDTIGHIVDGARLGHEINGEPIDEFQAMQWVLEQIRTEQRLGRRVKNFLDRHNKQ